MTTQSKKKSPEELRSYRWLGKNDLRSFGHRSRLRQFGYDRDDWVGKPVIGIINTWSDINACHGHLRARAEDVKRGVYQAGGFPIELPAMSLAEPFVKPSTMLYRNFLAMECEELLRCHPIDGAVLMGGCDKTTPGLLMGAVSMGVPAIYVPAGPMLRGNWRGQTLGSGSDAWKYWDEKRAGRIGDEEWNEIEGGISRSFGTCMVMGTAATMMAIAEALGMALPGASSIPAPDANHPRMCAAAGRRAVEMVWEDLTPDKILTPSAFDNAIRVHMALGGSTNAIIHVIALARRAGIALDMARFDEISREVPVIANITPSGKYLMEDFFYAGGLRALMAQMKDLLDLSCLTVNGRSVGDNISGAGVHLPDVIHALSQPLYPEGATAVLTGNLAPRGCVMKPAAAEQRLLKHRGKAIAFENYDHMAREVDRDDLDVTADHVLVLKNGGPKGGPGMPEWGQLPIPKKLLKAGVRDMLRISDARMSGTSYGACILHVAPESFVGGPLAFVQTGDEIEVDVEARRIHLHVGDEEMARRRAAWKHAAAKISARLWRDVLTAHRPGRRGLRLRFSGRHGEDRGAGDTLMSFRGGPKGRAESTTVCGGITRVRHLLLRRVLNLDAVASRHGTERDVEPVGAVDGDDRQRQVGKLFFGKLRARLLVDIIRRMAFGDQRQRLGPGQGGALALAVERRFLPGVEQIKPLLAFAGGAQLLGVHVDAVGAAVDLRGAQLDEFKQRMFEAAAVDKGMQLADGFGALRGRFAKIHAGFHGHRSLLCIGACPFRKTGAHFSGTCASPSRTVSARRRASLMI